MNGLLPLLLLFLFITTQRLALSIGPINIQCRRGSWLGRHSPFYPSACRRANPLACLPSPRARKPNCSVKANVNHNAGSPNSLPERSEFVSRSDISKNNNAMRGNYLLSSEVDVQADRGTILPIVECGLYLDFRLVPSTMRSNCFTSDDEGEVDCAVPPPSRSLLWKCVVNHS